MYETKYFQHAEMKYEVRITSDGHTFRVRVYVNGKPANGYTYSVELLAQLDSQVTYSLVNPVEELVNTAITDVTNGVWEKYLAAMDATNGSQTGPNSIIPADCHRQ